MPKVSVIVPVYNVEQYLERCLESLVNQTLEDIEIIIIDDSSPDNSHLIIEKYALKYPKKIRAFLKENGGIADTRNFGLTKITGEYFGFLDSDDYCELDMFEKMYNKAKSNDSDIVVSNFTWVWDNKTALGLESSYKPGKDMIINLFAVLWNKIYKTEFIKEVGINFPKGLRYEDASFLYKLPHHVKKIDFIDESFVHYIQRDGSITHTHNSKVKDMIYVFTGILNYYKEQGIYSTYQSELEYLFIKFFLGNSYLRTIKIKNKKDRIKTLKLSWDILNNNFPNWRNNLYLKEIRSSKHTFFKLINKRTYFIFAKILKYKK